MTNYIPLLGTSLRINPFSLRCPRQLNVSSKKKFRQKVIKKGTHYNAHTDPIFAATNTLRLEDMYKLNIAKLANSVVSVSENPGSLRTCRGVVLGYILLLPKTRVSRLSTPPRIASRHPLML
jgi:hypothetical protein